ncbi:MAG: hypothetical protein AAB152_10135 [Candidatus Coatesbacteria bacterium]
MAAALGAAVTLGGCAGPTMSTKWGSAWETHDVQLNLEELRREKVEGKVDVVFRLRATGVPKGRLLLLWHKSRGGRPVRVPGVYLADDGRLVSVKDRQEAELHAWGLARGEAYDLGAASEDGTVRAFIKVTPFPLEAKGPGGIRVWAELASARGDAWIVNGEGFRMAEEINTVMTSGEEAHLDVVMASPTGTFSRVLFPAAWFHEAGGMAAWKATAKSGSVELTLGWGDKALRAE